MPFGVRRRRRRRASWLEQTNLGAGTEKRRAASGPRSLLSGLASEELSWAWGSWGGRRATLLSLLGAPCLSPGLRGTALHAHLAQTLRRPLSDHESRWGLTAGLLRPSGFCSPGIMAWPDLHAPGHQGAHSPPSEAPPGSALASPCPAGVSEAEGRSPPGPSQPLSCLPRGLLLEQL